jgi:hypothetical protein
MAAGGGSMSAPLYAVAQQYRADLDALAEIDGLDAQTIADTVEGLQGELQDKLRAVIAYALGLSVEAAGQAEAAKRMADRAKGTEKRAEGLLEYARVTMQATGVPEVSTDEWAAKLARKPPSVQIQDAALIPPEFMRTPEPPPPAPDKAAIAQALKLGQAVPGCELVQGFRLAVK